MSEILLDLAKKNNLSPQEKIRKKNIEKGKCSFWEYEKLINPSFFKEERSYQKIIAETMQAIYEKKLINPKTKKPYDILIVNLPPGAGKSYNATTFTTWAYGQNIKNAAITVSYNQTLSTRFAKTVRDTIEDKEIPGDINSYVVNSFFPNVKIKFGDGAMNLWSLEGSYMSYLASSFDGSITGMRGNIGIIDDPIKNKEEAMNENTKEKHWDFYKNTFASRMLPGAVQFVILTRWASDDLAGKLLANFPERCYELKIPALDKENKSWCEDLYSTEDLMTKKSTLDDDIWLANYMQEPIDKKGALYGEFKTYDVYDPDKVERKIAYTDTADEGADFLCQITADVIDKYGYVTDIYYTDEPMEKTEPESARRLNIVGTKECAIESNNGGRGFARNVIEHLKRIKNSKCNVSWFHQSKNKKTRILVNATNVMEQIIMPEGWKHKYPEFYKAISKYQRKGKNDHDDAADCLTGLVEIINGEVKVGSRISVLKSRNKR